MATRLTITVHDDPSNLFSLERDLVREAASDGRIGIRDIGHAADAVWLVAEAGGAAAGVATLAHFSEESCHLDRLYVRPSARGRGVGEALVDAARRLATKRGLDQLLVEAAGSSGRFWRRCLGDEGVEWIAPHLVEVELRPVVRSAEVS